MDSRSAVRRFVLLVMLISACAGDAAAAKFVITGADAGRIVDWVVYLTF
jgi:hypothetical protein